MTPDASPAPAPKQDDIAPVVKPTTGNGGSRSNIIYALLQLMKPMKLILPASAAIVAIFMGFTIAQPGDSLPLFFINSSYPFLTLRPGYFTLIEAGSSLLLVFAASHAINDVYDAEIDAINRPHRPIPSGVLSTDDAYSLAMLLYLFGLFRSMFVNTAFSLLVLAIVLLTLLYSVPPVRLKKRFVLNNMVIGLSYGLLIFLAGWSVFGNIFDPTPWVLGLLLTFFLLGASTTKDFHDLPGDKLHGAKTLPVVLGVRGAFAVVVISFLLPYPLIVLFIWLGLIKTQSYMLLALVVWGVYCILYLRKSLTRLADSSERPHYSTWFHTHSMTLMLVIGFFVVYLMV